jgi:hypothetical protein
MSLSGPYFHAWCDDRDRVDTYAAALTALSTPKVWHQPISVNDAVAAARAMFAAGTSVDGSGSVKLHSGDVILFDVLSWRDAHKRGYTCGPLFGQPDDQRKLLALEMQLARGGTRSVEVEAAVVTIATLENIKDLLLRLCAPDETKRVTTGTCTWFQSWGPPVLACATYNMDVHVVRDLALSWIHLHDKDDVEHIAGLSLDALRARVEAAPPGAHVTMAGEVELLRDKNVAKLHLHLPVPERIMVRGARLDLVGEDELTREQVLKALDTPSATLLEALEAAAFTDDEWRAVEAIALETIEAKKQGAPCYEEWVTSRKHLLFIQHHAPYHVRRLPNGGVLLATHPYRTLWKLWADALDLLGIRTNE